MMSWRRCRVACRLLVFASCILLGKIHPVHAQAQAELPWRRCVDLFVYIDISQSMTQAAGGESYKKSIQSVRDLTKASKPLWLDQCVNLEVSFFGSKVSGSFGPIKIDRAAVDGSERSFLYDLEKKGLSYGEDVTRSTNLAAVLDEIRLRAADQEIPSRSKKMFLIYSDFAHDPEGGGVVQDTAEIRKFWAEQLEGERGLLWRGFDDPSQRLLIGHVFAARSADDAKRQRNFVDGLDSMKTKGIHFLENPSLEEIESIISENISPLSMDARRSSDNRGWDVDIRNMEVARFRSLEAWITCDTEISARGGASHRKKVEPAMAAQIDAGELLENRRVDDPFLLPDAPVPGGLVKCILEIFGRSEGMNNADLISLGSTTLYHGIFIEVDLDYVLPELSFFAPGKPTANVLFKLRGQVAGGEKDCDDVRLNLLVRRGDGAVSLLRQREAESVQGGSTEVSLKEARRLAGEEGACSLHPQRWTVFSGKLELDKRAREIPICGHRPPPLVFRAAASGMLAAQDEEIWKHRFDEEIFPKRDGEQQGHELTREIILPVFLSSVIAILLLKLRRTRVTMDDFTNVLAFVLLIAAGLYAILHEYTLIGQAVENFVASNGPKIAIVIGFCIVVLVSCAWRWGIFGLEPTKEVTRLRLLQRDMRMTIWRRKMFRAIPMATLLAVLLALAVAWRSDTWERQCVYQDIYVPPSFLERLR